MTVLLFIFLYLAVAVGVGSLWSGALDKSAAIRDGKVDPGDRVLSCLAPMLWPFTGAPALVYVINTHMRARGHAGDIRQRAIQAYKDDMDLRSKVLEEEIFGGAEEPEVKKPRQTKYQTVYEAEARKIMEKKRGW